MRLHEAAAEFWDKRGSLTALLMSGGLRNSTAPPLGISDHFPL